MEEGTIVVKTINHLYGQEQLGEKGIVANLTFLVVDSVRRVSGFSRFSAKSMIHSTRAKT